MKNIRKAEFNDLCRIAEIEIFNYRLYFYPIFLNDEFYFGELQVRPLMKKYEDNLSEFHVYDDGVIKGFIQIRDDEVVKLFVEPIFRL